jgi:hypothetical protein
MAKTEVTAVQVQMAAAAGVKIMQVDDLPVPMSVAKSGALGILEGILQALANGEVVLTPPQAPQQEAAPAKGDESPKGDQEPPKKDGNSGGKKRPAA